MSSQGEIYCCCRCNFKAKYSHRLQKHLKVHKLHNTVTCTSCGAVFQNLRSMTLWHTWNGLKEHLASKKELLKNTVRKCGLKNACKIKDKLNVVLFSKDRASGLVHINKSAECGVKKFTDSKDVCIVTHSKSVMSCDNTCKERTAVTDAKIKANIGKNIEKKPLCFSGVKDGRMLMIKLKRCAGQDLDTTKLVEEKSHCQDKKITSDNCCQLAARTETRLNAKMSTDKTEEKFQCTLCNFTTKYKKFWNLHIHAHLSSGTVTCELCNIVFLNNRSMAIWHAKNSLQEHIGTVIKYKHNPKRKTRFYPFKRQKVPKIKQRITQTKPTKPRKEREMEEKLKDCEKADRASFQSVIKTEPIETAFVDCSNYQTFNGTDITSKTIFTSNLDKNNEKLINEYYYCDDLLAGTIKSDSVKISSNCLVEGEGLRKETLLEASEAGPDDGAVDGNTDEEKKSSDNKDFNNNVPDRRHDQLDGHDGSNFRDENNNVNKDSGDGSDDNEDSFNEEIGSPKSIELLTCLICQASFGVRTLLIKHLVKIHNLTNLCRICYFRDFKIMKFANPVSLRNHRLKCHETEMKKCVCGTLFIDDKTLNSHQRKFRCTEIEHPSLLKCICGKRFSTEKGLNSHKALKCRKRKHIVCDNQYKSNESRRTPVRLKLRKLRAVYADNIKQDFKCVDESYSSVGKRPAVNKGQRKNTSKPIRNVKGNQSRCCTVVHGLNSCTESDLKKTHKAMEDTCAFPPKIREKKSSEERGRYSKSSSNKCLSGIKRKTRECKVKGCRICNVQVKRRDTFTHQKICHQRRTVNDPIRKWNLRSGSLKKYRCGWCKFVAVHWKTILYHHYSNHQQHELDVIVIQLMEDKNRLKPCSVILQRI